MRDSLKIIKVRKNEDGDITDIMLEDGRIYPMNYAIMKAKNGAIEDVTVGKGKDGGEFLKTESNECIYDNLSELPRF